MIEPSRSVLVAGSLRRRLMLALVGGAAILALLLFFIVRNYAAQIAQQGQDDILRASVSSILSAATLRDGEIDIDLPYASFSMLSTPSDDRVFYSVYQDDQFLSGYRELTPLETKSDRIAEFRTVAFLDEPVRKISASRLLVGEAQPTKIRFTLAQTQDALSGRLANISLIAALIGLGFFVLAALLSLWVTSTTVGPMKRLSTSITRRGPQDLRPFEKPVPAEMVPLVASLNSLMGRLDYSLQQSENFITEAAHRIRTPLATVRSHAETTLYRVEKEENRKAVRAMVRAIDESSRAAGQLLDHAMITFRADHLERSPIDLVELIQELVLRLTPIADMRDIELRLTGISTARCSGDPVLIQNAARNLIENALNYAPAETDVEIDISRDEKLDSVALTIRDEGLGFPDDQIASLTNRFERGRNARGTTGSGLGLTIAKDVARAHGGALTLTNRTDKQGACVTFSF